MNLRDLQYLVALADQRHFGRAAEQCFVSQPTLSVRLSTFSRFRDSSARASSGSELLPRSSAKWLAVVAEPPLPMMNTQRPDCHASNTRSDQR